MGEGIIRLALLGCGSFGESHARTLRTIRGAELASVFDPAIERARVLSQLLDVPVSASPSAIWEDQSIDGVIIATPTNTHRELTESAARSGKHVLVEKPAALSTGDLIAMQQVCDEHEVVLFVGQTLRFHPVIQSFQRAKENGSIGEPVYFNWIVNSRRPWPGGWRGWQTDDERSGGLLIHLGIHSIDLALWLLASRPQRVYAQGIRTGGPGLDTPDLFQVSIRCENNANALLELHTNLSGTSSFYRAGRLIGTLGQAEWALNEDGVAFTDSGAGMLPTGSDLSLRDELRHFIDCCRGDAKPLITSEQALDALATAIAARRSLTTCDAVEIPQDLKEFA